MVPAVFHVGHTCIGKLSGTPSLVLLRAEKTRAKRGLRQAMGRVLCILPLSREWSKAGWASSSCTPSQLPGWQKAAHPYPHALLATLFLS